MVLEIMRSKADPPASVSRLSTQKLDMLQSLCIPLLHKMREHFYLAPGAEPKIHTYL